MEVSQSNGVRERVMDDKECPFADMHNLRRVSGSSPFNSFLVYNYMKNVVYSITHTSSLIDKYIDSVYHNDRLDNIK